MKEKTRISTLSNGIRVVTQKRKTGKVAFIFMVGCGSICEPDRVVGVSHALEHMMFKGTTKRNALEISKAIKRNGGRGNASTGTEKTSYLFTCPASKFEEVASIYADMLNHSVISEDEWNRERNVILEEKQMSEKSDNSAYWLMLEKMFDLRMGIIGSQETIKNIRVEDMREIIRKYYLPENIVISVAGGIVHEKALEILERFFGNFHKSWKIDKKSPEINPIKAERGGYAERIVSLEQTSAAIGFPSYNIFDGRRYALALMCNILGGGSSSRLFNEVREKRGLAYSVYSGTQFFRDMGVFFININTTKPAEAIEVIIDEMEKMKDSGAERDEIEQVKFQIKSDLLCRETSYEFAENNAKSVFFGGHAISEEEYCAKIDAVTAEDILGVARDILDLSKATVAMTGPDSLEEEIKEMIK